MKKKKIYFSASITAGNADPTLGLKIVRYLQSKTCEVLSEHVASLNVQEMNEILKRRANVTEAELSGPQRAHAIRRVDTQWVDEATHLVVLITGPSLGVGMEIERALLKPERNLPETPILCLVPQVKMQTVSNMVLGITTPSFTLVAYEDEDDLFRKIDTFLETT